MPEKLLTDPYFAERLNILNERLPGAGRDELPHLLSEIPLAVFAHLLLGGSEEAYPHIAAALPRMPSPELQRQWVGSEGVTLMMQSVDFIKTLLDGYERHGTKPLSESAVLDYGCGWGRLTRLLYKFVPISQIHGVDPSEYILDECKRAGMQGNFAAVSPMPDELPFSGKMFDLVFAFSVFTHLSEATHLCVLRAIQPRLNPGGILALTIRPRSYWEMGYHSSRAPIQALLERHDHVGFAFTPAPNSPVTNGEATYGDTSITADYIRRMWSGWERVGDDINLTDPFQITVFLRRIAS